MELKPRFLILLLGLLYIGVAMAFSQVIPFNKGPDEETNLAYIEFIVTHGRLPITYPEREEVGKDANWPALYHLMVAGLSRRAGVPSADLGQVKILWDSFQYRALDTGSQSAFYIRTEDQISPFYGKFLIWQIGRWLSIFWGAVTLCLLYGVILEMLPQQRWAAILGVALLAFSPVFVFMSSVLNEDTLMSALTTLYLWLLILIIKQPARIWRYWAIGLVLGLSITIKYTTIVLPLEIVVIIAYLKQHHGYSWTWYWQRVIIAGFTTIIGCSWWFGWIFWYLNEVKKYGLIVGLLRPLFTGGPDVTLARFGYFFSGGEIGLSALPENRAIGTFGEWIYYTALSFWGVSAGDSIPWFPFIYIFIILLIGLIIKGLWQTWQKEATTRPWIMVMVFHISLFFILPIVRFWLSRRIGETAQGRHILIPAAAAVIILMVWGIIKVIPRYGQPLIGLIFLGWTVAHGHRLATFVSPPLPMRTIPQTAVWLPQQLNAKFGDEIELVSYELKPQPENNDLQIYLAWRSLKVVTKNSMVKISLLNKQQQILSYWLGHPAQGRIPTLAWQPGDTIFDRLRLPLSNLAIGNYTLKLEWVNEQLQPSFAEMVELPVSLSHAAPSINLNQHHYLLWDNYIEGVSWAWLQHEANHYRYPATISILALDAEPQLLNEVGQVFTATYSTANIYTFVIGPRWPSGDYRLQMTTPQTGNEVILTVENWWPRRFDLPKISVPKEANFANQLKFLGYDLPQKQVKVGESFPLTLYWQAMPNRSPQADFTQFNNLLDGTGTLRGGYDRKPLEYYNTLLWVPGEIVVDGYTVPVKPDAPAGQYYLDVGYYLVVGQSAVNLPLVVDGKMSQMSSVTVGPIEVIKK